MKKQIYLMPIFALTLAGFALAGCDDKKKDETASAGEVTTEITNDDSQPVAIEETTTTEVEASEESQPVEAASSDVMEQSPISVVEATSYATAASSKTGAVFATIQNNSDKADILLDVRSSIAPTVEIHETYEDPQTGAVSMRRTSGVDIPAHGTVKLQPQGFHIMLLNLPAPLEAGTSFDVKMTFRNIGHVTVPVTVVSVSGQDAPEHHHEDPAADAATSLDGDGENHDAEGHVHE